VTESHEHYCRVCFEPLRCDLDCVTDRVDGRLLGGSSLCEDCAEDEPVDFIRTSGDMICSTCGRPYWRHDHDSKYEWLRVRCDGQRLKL